MKKKYVSNRFLSWKVKRLLNDIRVKEQHIIDVYNSYYDNELTALPAIQLMHEYLGAIKQIITDAHLTSKITDNQYELLTRWSIFYLDTFVNGLSFDIFNRLERRHLND